MIRFLLLLLVLAPVPAFATESRHAPRLWQAEETRLLAGGVVLVGLTLLADQSLDDRIRSNHSNSLMEVADALYLAGHPLVTFAVAGGILGYGLLKNNEEQLRLGHLAVESILVAQMATLALKYSSGRHRPDGANSSGSFSPVSFSGDKDSFPSGHTSGAFALASVLAQQTHRLEYRYGTYALAGLVGISRIYRGDHWASDVVAGALIGELSGRLIRRLHQDHQRTLFVIPWLHDGPGLQLAIRY